MALGITAVYNDSTHSPGYDISLSGLTGYTTYSVVRIDEDANYPEHTVRGGDTVPVTSNTAALSDYETQFVCNNRYTLRGYISGVLSASATTLVGAMPQPSGTTLQYPVWLKHTTIPTKSRLLVVSKSDEATFTSGKNSVANVLGRENPVVTTDTFGARTSSLIFGLPYNNFPGYPNGVNIQTVIALLKTGGVLLYQQPDPSFLQYDLYFVVNSFNIKQEHRPQTGVTDKWWTITVEYQEVDRPKTIQGVVSTTTWQEILDNEVTWTTVNSTFTTWNGVTTAF